MNSPSVVAVAIRYDGKVWVLGCPHRHHHIRHWIYLETGNSEAEDQSVEGFLDSAGRFLNRTEALIIARSREQLRTDRPIWGDDLYSENLW